jgi:hypothetical protein
VSTNLASNPFVVLSFLPHPSSLCRPSQPSEETPEQKLFESSVTRVYSKKLKKRLWRKSSMKRINFFFDLLREEIEKKIITEDELLFTAASSTSLTNDLIS